MESLQILWVNRSISPQGSGVKPHDHPYYHMFVCLTGELAFMVNDKSLILKKSDCIIIPRKTSHSYFNKKKTTVEALEIKFTIRSKTLASKIDALGLPFSNDALAIGLVREIVNEFESGSHLAEESSKSYLNAVLHLFMKSTSNSAVQSSENYEESELFQKISSYVEEHYQEPFSLDRMANDLAFNKTYLCTAFKKETDLTILDYFNLVRIRHAARLLSYSENSIAKIAKLCGFGSASTFNHTFQKYIGTTPSEVRKAYPNGIILENKVPKLSKSRNPNHYLFNVLAGRRIV